MTKNFKRLMIAGVIACSAVNGVSAVACGGSSRGGSGGRSIGFSGGFGGSFGRHSGSYASVRPTYAASVHTQYVHPQPVYSQPSYGHSSYAQPIQSQPGFAEAAPAPRQAPAPAFTPNQAPAPAPTRAFAPAPNQAPAPVASTRAPAPTQTFAQAPAPNRAPAPVAPSTQGVASRGAAPAAPSQPAAFASTAGTPPAGQSSGTPSALQMLASLTRDAAATTDAAVSSLIPEFAAASTAAVSSPSTGTWKVSLPGDQSVELNLNDDGQFTWTATKAGASNSFSGRYDLAGDQLTLIRSGDQQQMRGQWVASATGFTFQLDGSTTGGLSFTR